MVLLVIVSPNHYPSESQGLSASSAVDGHSTRGRRCLPSVHVPCACEKNIAVLHIAQKGSSGFSNQEGRGHRSQCLNRSPSKNKIPVAELLFPLAMLLLL
jgi:hypothetical protein